MGRFNLYLFFTLFSLLFISCSYTTFDGEKSEVIIVKPGERFRINFQETHDDGYTWGLKDKYDHHIINYTNSVWEGKTKGVFYYFRAEKAGIVSLEFAKRKYDSIMQVQRINILIKQ